MEEPRRERRLGQRHVLGPVAVRWRLDDAPATEDGGATPERAGLLDLSVSGARIMARDCDDLAVGDITTVQIRGAAGPVIVRRITPSSQSGFSTFGLEFADPTSNLPQLVHQELAQRTSSLGPPDPS
ncbi:MAG TPA: PilZ domain-containing protein [Acidimicrobiales bacterium]|nr:PilZ domain-containing protein [Acidimicrobiales bacterium]